jgi:methylglyoxal reductase
MQLGRSDLHISKVVLGCMWSPALSDAAIERIVHAAFDAGVTAFDTAPLYGFHRGERSLGRALRTLRPRVQILTKAGLRWDGAHGEVLFSFHDEAGNPRAVRRDSRPAQLMRDVEESLTRLGVEQLDLLQIHHPDRHTPLEDSLAALLRLKEQGKIRAIGLSNVNPEELEGACAFLGEGGLASLQTEYSLLHLHPEHALLPACQARQISLLAYSPLAQGALTDSLGSTSSATSFYRHPLVSPWVSRSVRTALQQVARPHGASAGQVALAFVLAQPGVAAVVGASSAQQATHNAGAARIALSRDEQLFLREHFKRLELPLKVLRRLLALRSVQRLDRLRGRVLRRFASPDAQ